jgi:hypothetical protein
MRYDTDVCLTGDPVAGLQPLIPERQLRFQRLG